MTWLAARSQEGQRISVSDLHCLLKQTGEFFFHILDRVSRPRFFVSPFPDFPGSPCMTLPESFADRFYDKIRARGINNRSAQFADQLGRTSGRNNSQDGDVRTDIVDKFARQKNTFFRGRVHDQKQIAVDHELHRLCVAHGRQEFHKTIWKAHASGCTEKPRGDAADELEADLLENGGRLAPDATQGVQNRHRRSPGIESSQVSHNDIVGVQRTFRV